MLDFAKPKIPSTLTMAETFFAMVMIMFFAIGVVGFTISQPGRSLMTLGIPVGYFYIRYFSGWV